MYATTVERGRPERLPVVVSESTGWPPPSTAERRIRRRLARRTHACARVKRVTTGRGRVKTRATRAKAVRSATCPCRQSSADSIGPARVYWWPAVEVPVPDCAHHGRFGAKKLAISDQCP